MTYPQLPEIRIWTIMRKGNIFCLRQTYGLLEDRINHIRKLLANITEESKESCTLTRNSKYLTYTVSAAFFWLSPTSLLLESASHRRMGVATVTDLWCSSPMRKEILPRTPTKSHHVPLVLNASCECIIWMHLWNQLLCPITFCIFCPQLPYL